MALLKGLGKAVRRSPKVGRGVFSRAADRAVNKGSAGFMGLSGKPIVAAGVGATLASSNLLSGDENTYGMQQALFEGVLGNPYADVAITGGHIDMFRASVLPDLIPGHSSQLEALRNIRSINRQSFSNFQAYRSVDKWRMGYSGKDFELSNIGRRLASTVDDAIGDPYGTAPGYNYPVINSTLGQDTYSPRVRSQAHDPRMGDIVFGAYNLRHG